MGKIEATRLPGVGMRHDFVTSQGRRIGLITHRGGDRELLLYRSDDPDACVDTVRLDADDLRALTELLGVSEVTEHVGGLRQEIDGLTIDWLPVGERSACVGRPLGLKEGGAATIVAVVRDGRPIPSPPPDFRVRAGDVAVLVGTPEGIKEAFHKLQGA